jgi:hypothetical protein
VVSDPPQKARQGASEQKIPPGVRNGLENRSYAFAAYPTNISAPALRRLTSPSMVFPFAFT